MRRLGFVGFVAMASACQGGAGEAGHSATARSTVTVTAHGPTTHVVRTAPSAAPDAAPALVTLRGRDSNGRVATMPIATPATTSPTTVATPGAMPAAGGYIVRGTGGRPGVVNGTTATATTGAVAMAPPAETAPRMRPVTTARREATGSMADGERGLDRGAVAAAPRAVTATPTPNHAGGVVGTGYGRGHPHSATGGEGGGSYAAAADEAAPPAHMSRGPAAVAAPTGGAVAMPPQPYPMPMQPPPSPPTNITVTITTPPPVIVAPVVVQEQQPVGLLTAASVGDSDRRDNYLSFLARHQDEAMSLGLDMSRRVRFRVVDAQGTPVNDARITLSGEGLQTVARTHADGTWDFFPGVSAPSFAGRANARVDVENVAMQAVIDVPPAGDGQSVTVQLPAVVTPPPPSLDLGFAIDVTGSMGDELRYVNHEIGNIVQRIEQASPGTHVRVSATFYRDRTDQVVVQQIPFTTNVAGFASTMQQVIASGGGDYPEDMNAGLEAALTGLAWSEGPAVRVLVLVADAPPQPYADENYTWHQAMDDASRRGIRILPVAASGADRTVEFLFRAMGTMTNTPYVYLTDESGIGAPHMEADTDRVAVERFNDLLTRLVISDLHGQGMHEPVPPGV